MFLKTLDPNEPMMIGSAGYGRDNEDFVELGMSYCMGGTGVIFSRRLIFDLQPFLSICIKNLFTEHEDMLSIELFNSRIISQYKSKSSQIYEKNKF